ncbi:extracellular solute-binding protein [Paenibacillus sp. TRM 82003]|nr:extracellular solute-binding protein [Paenibacillus sp. TRM 82003]
MQGRDSKGTAWRVGSLMLAMTLVLSACVGDNGAVEEEQPPGESTTTPNTEQSEGTSDGPMTKYDPPIEISMVRNLSDVVENNVLSVLQDETFEDNRWSRVYEDELGIKITYDWIVKGSEDTDQYKQKLNVTLASGELPDVTPVNAVQLKQLVDSDLVEDMTEHYEKYASPLLKDILAQEGPAPFDAATYDGKLMAIPQTGSNMESGMYLWVRTDWLEKLGLQPPKTMADVLAISKAFAEQDPDGNGADDTFGLAATKDLFGGFAGLEGFMAGYNAYPNMWLEDDSGKLVYGSVQPEVRTALLALQQMANNGEIDKEFGIKDGGKVSEDIASGKIGMEYGQQWNSIWPLQLNVNDDPEAQWRAFPIVSETVDTNSVKVPLQFMTTKFFAVRKGIENPEAVIKLFNMHVEKNWGETAEFDRYYAPPEAESVWQLSPVQPAPPKKNVEAYRAIDAARKANDFSKLEGEAKTIQEKIEAYESGSEEGFALWGWERIYSAEGSMGIADQYDRNGQYLLDKFVGAPTPTMVEREATLEKLQDEVFVKIILGEPIETFDKFVEDWKNLGGDDITEEVNEWYEGTK